MNQSITATRRRVTRLMQRIDRLERELAAERSLRRAIAALDFSPNQDPRKLGRVKAAQTLKQKLTNP